MKLVFDYDFVLFKACCAVESKSVKVSILKTQEEFSFKNRTEVYGNWRKKDGGWLAKQKGLALDDIIIEDETEVQPLANALQIVKTIIEGCVEQHGADSYYGYCSGEGNFRKDICTLLAYKGNRKDFIPPVHLSAAKQYLLDRHNAILSKDNEPDDCLAMDMYSALKEGKELIGVVNEKDYMGTDGNWFQYDQQVLHEVRGFGELYRNDKGDVKGYGRIWKYFQVCWQDSVDNYAANCFSEVKNGEVAVYNALKDCKDDKQAFEAMVLHFKRLYPIEKVVEGCKGSIPIDWFYVMQECFNMAHIHRWKNDYVNVNQVLTKLGVTC